LSRLANLPAKPLVQPGACRVFPGATRSDWRLCPRGPSGGDPGKSSARGRQILVRARDFAHPPTPRGSHHRPARRCAKSSYECVQPTLVYGSPAAQVWV